MSFALRISLPRAARMSRGFASSTVARKDFVQDLYIRELKAYTPPVQAKDAHLAHVKTYKAPSTPQPPTLPSDLASELAAYDAQEPGSAEPVAQASSVQHGVEGGAAEFLAYLEADIPKEEAHH